MNYLNKTLDKANSPEKNIIPALIAAGAAILGTVGSIISGSNTNRTNKQIAADTNALNSEQFGQQLALTREQMRIQQDQFKSSQDYATMDWNRTRQAAIEDWEREVAYNSPAAQRARYEAAGINPALAMQGQNQAIGSMESTSGSGSPSAGGQPGVPGAPNMIGYTHQDAFGNAIDRSIALATGLSQSFKSFEEASGIGLDNDVKRLTKQEQLLAAKLQNEQLLAGIDDMKASKVVKDATRENLIRQNKLLDDTLLVNDLSFDARVKRTALENYQIDRAAAKLNEEVIAHNISNRFAVRREISHLKLTTQQIHTLAAQAVQAKSQAGVSDMMAADIALRALFDGVVPDTKEHNLARKAIADEIELAGKELEDYTPNWWNRTLSGYMPFASGVGSAAIPKRVSTTTRLIKP